jgi:dienelactone hydrolase
MTTRVSRLAFLSLAALLPTACTQSLQLTKDDSKVVLAQQTLDAPSPAAVGPFKVLTLYYGSGTDKRRAYYRDSVKIKTKTVDGSAFVSMEPPEAKARKKHWGFDNKHYPLNGRVWYPDGAGPFPLVLVVHGNHNPDDYSDPGYKYLGELLASRGFILVSVDENFINGNLRNESDGRAWLLLEHFRAWKAFTDSSSNPFHDKVDWNNLGIMGHSRGGEAVGHAAAFNRMARYPDDANVKLGYNFNIRAVVAIAPIDAQYKPAGQFEPLENVNYLVIHGSHDGDVSTFHGLRQFNRLKFTDGNMWFKSAIYVYRANHGQWNQVWGNTDSGPTSARFLDLRGLITQEEQRQFGRVVIGGFLEATLHGRKEYLPMFVDHRTAGAWLPKTMYLTRFQENTYKPLASFDEDVDVTTGTVSGVTLSGDSLSTWKEANLPFRWTNDVMNTNAVWLGWSNRVAGDDTTKRGKPARFTVGLSDSLSSALALNDQSVVMLSLAPTSDTPGPRKAATDSTKKDSTKKDSTKAPAKKSAPAPKKKAEKDTTPVDLTVELEDRDGVVARLPLSAFGVPRRPLEVHVLRRAQREKQNFRNQFELIPQTYVMPIADFQRAAPRFAASRLRAIRLVFDRAIAGTVIVDDIGVANPDPAFLAHPVHAVMR